MGAVGPRPAFALALLLALLLGGCRAAPPPPAPAPPPPPAARPAPPEPAPAPDFCAALARIVDAEREGFAPVRGARLEDERFEGSVQPDGLGACRVEGAYWPAASYVCRVAEPAEGEAARLEPAFEGFAAVLDRCLARPFWQPRRWQAGRPMTLARGERLQQWHDNATLPRPMLILKIEEDIALRRFLLLLRVETFR